MLGEALTWVVLAAGALSALAGLMILLGGYGHAMPSFPASFNIPFATGVGFFLLGTGLTAIALRHPVLATLAGGLVGLNGFLALTVYVSGLHPMIEGIFPGDPSGVMMPDTAFYFFLSGAVLFVGGVVPSRQTPVFFGVFGGVIIGFGLVAFFSQPLGQGGWVSFTRMAASTATGFVVVGTGLLAQGWRLAISKERVMPAWLLPLAAGVGSLTVVVFLCQTLVANQGSRKLSEVRRMAHLTAGEIQAGLSFYVQAFGRMAERWRARPGGTPRDEWERDVRWYLTDLRGLIGMAWIDTAQNVRWRFPSRGYVPLAALDLAQDVLEQRGLFLSQDVGEPVLSYPLTLEQGNRGMLLLVPIGDPSANGYVAGLFRLDDFFASYADRLSALGLSMQVLNNGKQPLYSRQVPVGDDPPTMRQQVSFEVFTQDLGLELWSREAYSMGSGIYALLGSGILLSLFLSAHVHFWQTNRNRARRIQDINKTLRNEVSEREAAQVELRKLNETLEQRVQYATARWRDLYDGAPDMFCTVDAKTERVTECNRTLLDVLGYGRDEVIGRAVLDFYHPDCLEAASDVFGRFCRMGKVSNAELQLRRKTGEGVEVSLSVSAVRDEAGRLLYGRCIWRDISDLKQLREQLVQSQKMESVGRLAGGIAHDFNNQLFVIEGYCDVLSKRVRDPELLSGPIEEIRKAAQRSAQITGQLLAFGRRQVLQPRVLNLNTELRELEGMLQRLIGEDVVLTIVEGEGVGSVKVDWGQFQQVVMNLAANARDAMPDGGRLVIETSNVEVDEAYAGSRADIVPGSYVLLSVSDTGCGMDRETLGRIFEPFFTTKGQGVGTGLGLPTVHGIIEQSGGHIHVYSERGRGTTFKIYLPRVNQPEEQAGAREAVELPAGSETILLVEDEGAVRQLVHQILAGQGYLVLVAEDGNRALEKAGEYEGRIDLLITDVVMPGMSGRELVERLAGLRPEARVLYMSGYTENVIDHHGVLDEGVAFMQKPFSAQELLEKVRQVLSMPVRSAGRGKRVLVVDDSPTALRLQQVLLAESGYEVLTAGDGEEAWEVLQKERVDLVMTDVNLPVLGGLGLTERMRSSADFRQLPVVVLTGAASEAERVRFEALNVQAYLQKGTVDNTLVETVLAAA